MYYKYNLRLHVSEDSSTIEYTKYTTAKYSTCQLYWINIVVWIIISWHRVYVIVRLQS